MSERVSSRVAGTRFRDWVVIGLLVAAALASRWVFACAAYIATIDTGTVELMALRILEGDRPLFFYGQGYMGAMEAYVASLMVLLFGHSGLSVCLSPMLFAGGWVASTYLLFRELLVPRAGVVAALCVAMPGWYTMWYTTAPYGGYPAIFCLGTAACWLSVRCVRRSRSLSSRMAYAAGVGVLGAVGLWTHFLIAPYLLTAWSVLILERSRLGGFRAAAGMVVLSGLLCLPGLAPTLAVQNTLANPNVASFSFSMHHLAASLDVLRTRNLPPLIFETFRGTEAVAWPALASRVGLLLAAGAAAVGIAAAMPRVWRTRRLAVFLPCVFAAWFLALYLPHSRSLEGAPRYLIPLWSMAMSAVWAIAATARRPTWRTIALAGFAVWITVQSGGTAAYAARQHSDKAFKQRARAEAVVFAENAGLSTVRMMGGRIFGLHGQHLTFRSGGDIRFVSSYDEREYSAERAAETDPNLGWLCETSLLDAALETIEDLQAVCRVDRGEWYSLIHHVEIPLRGRMSVPPREIGILLDGSNTPTEALTDRDADTWVEGVSGDGTALLIDLGRPRSVDSLWLFAPDPEQSELPTNYRLEIASEPGDFRTLQHVQKRISVGYALGDRLFLKGYYGVMEIRCEPVSARYLRLTFDAAQSGRTPWRLQELYVFEQAPDPEAPADLAELPAILEAAGIDFVATDRVLSGTLHQMSDRTGAGPDAFLPFNATRPASLRDRHIPPRRGLAVAPRTELAADCRRLLQETYGPDCIREEIDTPPWRLLLLDDATTNHPQQPRLMWNGFTLLKSSEL